jgi:hypothetical protein
MPEVVMREAEAEWATAVAMVGASTAVQGQASASGLEKGPVKA